MAEIDHTYVEVTGLQTTTSTSYIDIPGAVISNTWFTVGDRYVILVCAQVSNEAGSDITFVRTIHGSTEFAGSEQGIELGAAFGFWPYCDFFYWTAVAGEDIKLQFYTTDAADEASARFITLIAIRVEDDFAENTDLFYNEDSTSTTLGTSWSSSNNASVTFTPGAANDKWLVMARSRMDIVSLTVSYESRINRSGEASDTDTATKQEGEDASGFIHHANRRVFTLGAVSNTFTEQSRIDEAGTTEARTHSKILVLNLSKFKDVQSAWTNGAIDINLVPSEFGTEIQTLSITPSQTGDVVCLSGCCISAAGGGAVDNILSMRMQVDNADQPPGLTAASLSYVYWDGNDEVPIRFDTVESLDNSAHTIDLDGSNDISGARDATKRVAIAFSMELAAASPIVTYRPQEDLGFVEQAARDFWGDRQL
jgi:hypothetical protein